MKKNIKHFFLLTSMATGCIYGFNKFIETTSGIKKLLSANAGNYFPWRYGKIFYSKQGKGSPLLLIHELNPASSMMEWKNMIRKLEKKHTVYTLDLLGCGRSDKPNLTYTNYMYVQLITDFVKKIIQKKTDVIATESSCSFTLMAATMDETIFDKIFFISPPSLESQQLNPNKKELVIKKILDTPVFGTFFYNILMTEKKISKVFEKKYYYRKELISANMKGCYYEAAHAKHGSGKFLLGSIYSNYTNININTALKKIKNSIYVIGSRENENSIRIMDSYTNCNANIETAHISNCKMLPQLEVPEKLYEIINMFYES